MFKSIGGVDIYIYIYQGISKRLMHIALLNIQLFHPSEHTEQHVILQFVDWRYAGVM